MGRGRGLDLCDAEQPGTAGGPRCEDTSFGGCRRAGGLVADGEITPWGVWGARNIAVYMLAPSRNGPPPRRPVRCPGPFGPERLLCLCSGFTRAPVKRALMPRVASNAAAVMEPPARGALAVM